MYFYLNVFEQSSTRRARYLVNEEICSCIVELNNCRICVSMGDLGIQFFVCMIICPFVHILI